MSWVDEVQRSIPSYAADIKTNLELAMENSNLDEVDAHACALAASCAMSNGGLANEIAMNGPLFGRDERDIAKTAAVSVAMLDTYYSFANSAVDPYTPAITVSYTGTDHTKFVMYSLAAAVTLKSNYTALYVDQLLFDEISEKEIQDIAKIAAVIAAVNKIVT